MNARRFLLLTLLFALSLLASGPTHEAVAQRFVFQEDESQLQVSGTSTVHDWTCNAGRIIGFVQGAGEGADSLAGISQARVTVPVRAIDCGSGTMERKLRDALGADDHAEVRYTLTQAAIAAATAGEAFQVEAEGELSMAGQTRPVTMTVDATRLPDGRLRFTGRVPLAMSTFDIDPPTAMLGTLKTGDRVEVKFNVVAAPLSSD